jgi:hypothetical protein
MKKIVLAALLVLPMTSIAFAQAVKDPQGTPGGGLTADNGITGATSADSVNNPGTNDEMTISGNPGHGGTPPGPPY